MSTAPSRQLSPTTSIRKALRAAATAEGFCWKNPISAYEANPTPPQPISSMAKLSASTRQIMVATKRFK